jgi:antitoxin component of MazEF toxin-antitoxin module
MKRPSIKKLASSTGRELSRMRYLATYTPREGDEMFREYEAALERIKPVFEERTGLDMSNVQVQRGGFFTTYARMLTQAYKDAYTETGLRGALVAPAKVLGVGIAGTLMFPLYLPTMFQETFTIGENINVNVSTGEFGIRIYDRKHDIDVRGDLEEELAENLANIHWNRNVAGKGKGRANWKWAFNGFMSRAFLEGAYPSTPWEVEKERKYPHGRVMRIRQIMDEEGRDAVLELPQTWEAREQELSMADYVAKNEPPQRKEKEKADFRRFLKLFIPVHASAIALTGGLWWYSHRMQNQEESSPKEEIKVEEIKQLQHNKP